MADPDAIAPYLATKMLVYIRTTDAATSSA